MRFQYWPAVGTFDSRGKLVKRPILELELIGEKGASISTIGVVDSGADTTTLNIQFAKALNIKLEESKTKEIIGIGDGKVKVYLGKIRFKIKHTEEEIEVPAWYVDSDNVNFLIGQEVFFDTYRIKFEKDHDSFEIVSSRRGR
ncbi:hypothetical protein COU12_01245 [Candidatus Jorgensenbacteria bacterium CG10_big_fil_rev_8_21_14_0_10_54_38]|uniref:Peptidase A2 domain-containing protein n=2 Tax=Candidatus Joergenseniibacteriota TaxID=1752739 RepID=A0A2M6WG49_9BACT|nr:MAG: hypothetical protein COX26_01115 [Candidatus Jorgensenbacteria bacterium CG23_combo_of_CG06-09_8_20_14_all_54_14]PIT91778.1 MAG: hypothetical protein COU12_01245 [Candidatus Jorgensenbacteria bacterium CG10_big_fil_rev_8_21_14_0_10_54_38]